MTTINNEMEKGFITIQDWMFELGLTGNDVIVYALIYGFSQDNRTWFNGSLNYIIGNLKERGGESANPVDNINAPKGEETAPQQAGGSDDDLPF